MKEVWILGKSRLTRLLERKLDLVTELLLFFFPHSFDSGPEMFGV